MLKKIKHKIKKLILYLFDIDHHDLPRKHYVDGSKINFWHLSECLRTSKGSTDISEFDLDKIMRRLDGQKIEVTFLIAEREVLLKKLEEKNDQD